MKPQLFRRGLAASLVCLVLFLGCNQAQRRGVPCALFDVTPPADEIATASRPDGASPAPDTNTMAEWPAPLKEPSQPPPGAPVLQTTWQEPGPIQAALTSRRRQPASEEHSPFDRADNYEWLVGELQYVHVRDAWRLRYAAPDEDDRYGGSVTLVGTGAMADYRNGQIVRVMGELADPNAEGPSPVYRVRHIERVLPEPEFPTR